MSKIKIVSIWNPKGGQGKSMLALNLSAAALELGIKPLVICQDQQGTSMLYYRHNNLPFEVVADIPAQRPDADIVFFDHQASDWEVPDANLLLMPLKPARDQYATYMDAYKRAKAQGKEIITVVTDPHMHRKDEKETTEYLKGQGAFVIPSNGAFSRAASDYRTIYDQALNKAYKVGERRREISSILGALLLKSDSETNSEEEQEHVAA